MDERSKFELEQLGKRMEEVEDTLEEQDSSIQLLAKQLMKVWHIGIGVSAGLLLDKLGIERFIQKFLL